MTPPDASASPFRGTPTPDALNALSEGTAIRALGIEFTEIGADFVRATMPVDARTRQLTVTLRDVEGRGLWSTTLDPHRR